MATRYALIEFTDADGTHQIGEKIDVQLTNDAEKANDNRLLDGGVYSKTQPKGVSNRPAAKGEQETK